MQEIGNAVLNDLTFYFVVQHDLPDGERELSLSSYAPFRDDCTTFPFDTETDAALYLLAEFHHGAIVSSNDIQTAKAIIRGEQPLFVYEEKQPDGTLFLSFHDLLPPEDAHIIAFGSRSAALLARFLLRRLHESSRIQASSKTIKRAQALLN